MMLHFSSLTTARFQLMVTLLKLAWQNQNFLEVWRCAPRCILSKMPSEARPRLGRASEHNTKIRALGRKWFKQYIYLPPNLSSGLLSIITAGSVYLLLGAVAKGARLARIIDRVDDHGNQL